MTFTDSGFRVDRSSPLFHRWLPDGERDAVLLKSPPDHQLRVWFERRGVANGDFVNFSSEVDQLSDELLNRIGALASGPLTCEISFEASEDDLQNHEKLAKRIFRISVVRVQSFIDILRLKHGQFWLSDVPTWSSESNGTNFAAYCADLRLRFSCDGGDFADLRPGEPSSIIRVKGFPIQEYKKLITKEDWRALGTHPVEPIPDGEAELLDVCARALRELDAERFRSAVIDACTACELALRLAISRSAGDERSALEAIDGEAHRLAQKVAAAAGIMGYRESKDVQKTFYWYNHAKWCHPQE